MRDAKTQIFIRAALIVWAVLLVLSTGAFAKDRTTCSATDIGGDWGYTETGTLILPTGAAPFAAVGKVNFDLVGNATGTQTSSLGGKLGQDVVKATYSINDDCTGTMTVGVYDQSGTLLRTIGLEFVLDDNATENRAVVTSLVLANGMSLPTIITLEARKSFPKLLNLLLPNTR